MDKGYVYVLINPSFKEDWVKIWKSKRTHGWNIKRFREKNK